MRRCHYCNAARGTTTDHIVPKALGGPNIQWNYVRACPTCNGNKADSWPDCPCGACTLAVEMYLWCKQVGGGRGAAVSAVRLFQSRLWAERIDRLEWWEDAGWINSEWYRRKPRQRKKPADTENKETENGQHHRGQERPAGEVEDEP